MTVSIPFEIPFHDVDSLGVVWHGRHYKYFELVRTALYRSMKLDVGDIEQIGYVFPVIESFCRYRRVLKYGQQIILDADLREYEYYILIEYRIIDADSGTQVANGYTKQAVCDRSGQLQLGVPDAVKGVLQAHVIPKT